MSLVERKGFKIGCTVEILDAGELYPRNRQAFKESGLPMDEWAKYCVLETGAVAIYIGSLESKEIDVVKYKGNYYMIGQRGLGKVQDNTAVGMLKEAADCIGDRAAERDTESERSMAATVRAFNGMFGTELTEEQGWQFMVLLKMARAKGGEYRRDDYVDGAAYFALAGECR